MSCDSFEHIMKSKKIHIDLIKKNIDEFEDEYGEDLVYKMIYWQTQYTQQDWIDFLKILKNNPNIHFNFLNIINTINLAYKFNILIDLF